MDDRDRGPPFINLNQIDDGSKLMTNMDRGPPAPHTRREHGGGKDIG